jgi:hypothetical protein
VALALAGETIRLRYSATTITETKKTSTSSFKLASFPRHEHDMMIEEKKSSRERRRRRNTEDKPDERKQGVEEGDGPK